MSVAVHARNRIFPLSVSLIDIFLVGGGLSLIAIPFAYYQFPEWLRVPENVLVMSFFLNGAHFAASTVLLYGRSYQSARFAYLKYGLPVVFVSLLMLGGYFAEAIGSHLVALYLTWSPFHYTAQTYGLVLIYLSRDKISLSDKEKSFLWWAAILPFFWTFLSGLGTNTGIGWFISRQWLIEQGWLHSIYLQVTSGLRILVFSLPVLFLVYVSRTRQKFSLIVGMLLISNATWWVVFSFWGAFFWATVAHALQYLAVAIPKFKQQTDGKVPVWMFYGNCLLVAYALFHCLPYGCVALGLGYAESVSLSFALINIHHFVVDAFIWKKNAI